VADPSADLSPVQSRATACPRASTSAGRPPRRSTW
jgi:hypothetical protein